MKPEVLDSEWGVIARFLPPGWQELARSTGALQRARQVSSAEVLLRLIFLYTATSLSLRQAAARATETGLARISDVGLMKRLRNAEPWLHELVARLLGQSTRVPALEGVLARRRLRIVDATHVRVNGSRGTDFRLHYVLCLPSLRCDFAEVTDATGGETYTRVPVQPGDVILGDRGYCHRRGVAHVVEQGGDAVVRLNANSFPLLHADGTAFDLLPTLRSLQGQEPTAWLVRFEAQGKEYAARLCAVRKSPHAAERAKERLRKRARKKGKQLSAATLELAEYVFVLVTSGLDDLTAEQVLALYRVRWQVELNFKRLKSLFALGSAPNRDPAAVRSWIYAKLLAVLLMERLGEATRLFSPWGLSLHGGQPLEGVSRGG